MQYGAEFGVQRIRVLTQFILLGITMVSAMWMCTAWCSGVLVAQEPHVLMRSLPIQEIPSHVTVYQLYEHPRGTGVFWIVTAQGLYRFDGQSCRLMELPFDVRFGQHISYYCSAADSTGRIWLGTKQGVFCMNPTTGRWVRYLTQPPSRFTRLQQQQWVVSILCDHKGEMWFGTEAGLLRYRNNATALQSVTEVPFAAIEHIREDAAHTLWVATTNGLWYSDSTRKQFRRFVGAAVQSNPELPKQGAGRTLFAHFAPFAGGVLYSSVGVNTMLRDVRLARVAGVGASTQEYDQQDASVPGRALAQSNALLFDILAVEPNGMMWVYVQDGAGTCVQGLYYLPCTAAQVPARPVLEGRSMNFVRSDNGMVIAGVVGKGLALLLPTGATLLTNNAARAKGAVKSLLYESERLWAGTERGLWLCQTPLAPIVQSTSNDEVGQRNNGKTIDEAKRARTPWSSVSPTNAVQNVPTLSQAFRAPLWKRIPFLRPSAAVEPSTARPSTEEPTVYSCIRTTRGRLFVASSEGLFQYDAVTERCLTVQPFQRMYERIFVSHLAEDKLTGNIWVYVPSLGIVVCDDTGKPLRLVGASHDSTGISNAFVKSLYQDRFGTMWVGTLDGLNRWVRPKTEVVISTPQAGAVAQGSVPSTLTIGTPRLLSQRGESLGREHRNREPLLDAWVQFKTAPKADATAVLGYGTFYHYFPASLEPSERATGTNVSAVSGLPGSTIIAMSEDSVGRLVVVSYNGGIARLRNMGVKERHFTHNEAVGQHQQTLFETLTLPLNSLQPHPELRTQSATRGVGYTVSSKSVASHDTLSGVQAAVQSNPNEAGHGADYALTGLVVRGGEYWLMSVSSVLYRYIPDNSSFHSGTARSMLNTSKSALSLRPAQPALREYFALEERTNEQTGVQGIGGINSGAMAVAEDGTMFMDYQGDVLRVRPDEMRSYTQDPSVLITAWYSNDSLLQGCPRSGDTLWYDHEDQFAFSATVLNMLAPSRSKLFVRFEGENSAQQQWHEIRPETMNYVRYTNLQPGAYALRLKGYNHQGQWSAQEVVVYIVVPTPWYQTVYARAGFGALGLVVVGFAAAYRERHKQRKTVQQERAARERAELERSVAIFHLQTLQLQMDPHFTFNALMQIQHLMVEQETDKALDYVGIFASILRQVLQNNTSHAISIYDEEHLLQSYLDLERLRYADGFSYSIEYTAQMEEFATFSVPPMVIQPYVENALRHGLRPIIKGDVPCNRHPHVAITFALHNRDSLVCVVEDNGVGRKMASELQRRHAKRQHLSIATKITAERLTLLEQLYHKSLEVHYEDMTDGDNVPVGTRVRLVIPCLQRSDAENMPTHNLPSSSKSLVSNAV
jgi:ligand-binding sensor domain-containing protein